MYHIVFPIKYRRKVLTDELSLSLVKAIEDTRNF
ncbi:MAG: transposase [Flavobacteriaceae bacterium]|nr:transposase [Flavobacteriaceae bacterium]